MGMREERKCILWSAREGKDLGRFEHRHMPRNARFDCAAKRRRRRRRRRRRSARKRRAKAPATFGRVAAPAEINQLTVRVPTKVRERESEHSRATMSPETAVSKTVKPDLFMELLLG